MLAIVGTVPDKDFPVLMGPARLENNKLLVDGKPVDLDRGTPALLAAAVRIAEFLGKDMPLACLAGDIGLGHGSRELYARLEADLQCSGFAALAFHYLQPDVDWHNRILLAVEEMENRPLLIADAGYMYAAKMSGQAENYDLFTPDVGELAFLADETAPHPFYTRGFILHEDSKAPDYIRRAYAHGNAARHMLVKGASDFVADRNGILGQVDGPCAPALEAIGGTGDTLTGMVSALSWSGMDMAEACLLAAKANRTAGVLADLSPAGSVVEIIAQIPRALEQILGSAAAQA